MKTICAWCTTTLQDGEKGLEPVSHGICHTCAQRLLAEALELHPEVSEDPDQLELLVHNHRIDPSCKESVINGNLVGECLELGDETGG